MTSRRINANNQRVPWTILARRIILRCGSVHLARSVNRWIFRYSHHAGRWRFSDFAFHAALRFADPMAFMTPMIAKFIKFWPSPKAYNDESLAAKENRNYPKFATSAFASLWDYSQRMTNMLSFVKAPIVILQSRKDQVVNPQAAKIIHDKASSKDKTLVWFERSGHEMLLDLEADLATETVMTFIKRIAG